MAVDPEILRHKEWLGFLQPVGLVVSPPALLKAQAVVDRNVIDLQQTLQSVVSNNPIPNTNNETAWIADFSKFATEVLGWQAGDLVEAEELPKELEVSLPDYGEILSPSYGVPDVDGNGYLMLIKLIPTGRGMDEIDGDGEAGKGWQVSFQAKFERLLRATEIPVGLLCNGTELRLVYAPKGESSGHLTFPVQAMCEVSGRLILGAMSMLLGEYRLFSAPTGRRLTDLLAESRKYQAEVSTKLANQVLDALWELLGGFQTADAATGGKLLGELAATNPQHIYGGLITTLMRLVFLLYAEDEGLMPGDDIYQRNYAVSGLYERLREDAGNYPDTMDQRYGAWAWLLSLFRLVYDGGGHTPEYLPARHGQLFNPDEFFRRAFDLLQNAGTFGLIATNTIAQGDTRSTGLRFICQNGGQIYYAQKRFKWPGVAAVVVSIVNVMKVGCVTGKITKQSQTSLHVTHPTLNGKPVSLISAFLFHAGGNEDPAVLLANADKGFIGSYVLGMGFTFDDSNPDATPIAEMHRLIEQNPKNAERIFPYIGGEEVNSSPTHSHHRYVINFGEMSEAEALEYPDLMKIVEEKVKPGRLKQNREIRARYWWRFGETTPALFRAIRECDRILFHPNVSKHIAFAFISSKMIVAAPHNVFVLESNSSFCILQSRIHETWARFFGSSMKDDFRYTPSDCFETFPFPEGLFDEQSLANTNSNQSLSTIHSSLSTLEAIGKEYYEYRAALMIRNNQGLTDTYNRFHDPEERDPEILKLRQLHEKMDRAVLDAYGWQDIPTDCEFLLDYDDEEDEEETTGRQRKKPWRYRWREEIHDEVLARLLDLNQKRHEEEILGGKLAESKKGGKKKASKSRKKTSNEETLFDVEKFTNSNDGT